MSRAGTVRLANLLAFQTGWLACVLGAAWQHTWTGPVAVAALLGLHLRALPNPSGFGRFLLAAGLLGFTLDTALASAGVFAFHAPVLPAWVCPPGSSPSG